MSRSSDSGSLRDVLAATTRRLEAAGVASPAVDAQLLLRHVTDLSNSQLVLRLGDPARADVVERLERLVRRREAREPLQLLLGTVGFRYLTLVVRRGVFIPRPETEVLAGEAIARVPSGGAVVEPCTGTGAVACAISSESEAAVVVATDSSEAAVALATQNAALTGATVSVLQGDLLDPVPASLRGHVDVLVCNPPYLATAELEGRDPEVVDWDPVEALASGPTGHEITDRLLAAAPAWLRPGGWLLLEVDSNRAAEVAARAAGAGLVDAQIVPDLTGADRVVVARTSDRQ